MGYMFHNDDTQYRKPQETSLIAEKPLIFPLLPKIKRHLKPRASRQKILDVQPFLPT